MSRRPSSRVLRRRCYEYWVIKDGPDQGSLKCYMCGRIIDPEKNPEYWEAEHDIARGLGGSDHPPNVKPCCDRETIGCLSGPGHKGKTADDAGKIAKSVRIRETRVGIKRSSKPMPGSKRSKWKKKYNKNTGRWETVRRY